MIYRVTKQYSGSTEQDCQRFKSFVEAKTFVNESAATDAEMKIKVVYRIYEFDDIMLSVDSASIVPAAPSSSNASESTAGGISSGASFKPTPFEMSPRPKGTPPKWIIDPEEDKDKDKDK
jgi:hypothetical protein